jgi:hypothetical protein
MERNRELEISSFALDFHALTYPLSLSFKHRHTHTHTHLHTHKTHTFPFTHSPFLSLCQTHSHTHTHTLICVHPHNTHISTYSPSLSLSNTISLILSSSLPHVHTLTHSISLSLSKFLYVSITFCSFSFLSLSLSLSPLNTHSNAHTGCLSPFCLSPSCTKALSFYVLPLTLSLSLCLSLPPFSLFLPFFLSNRNTKSYGLKLSLKMAQWMCRGLLDSRSHLRKFLQLFLSFFPTILSHDIDLAKRDDKFN